MIGSRVIKSSSGSHMAARTDASGSTKAERRMAGLKVESKDSTIAEKIGSTYTAIAVNEMN